MAPADVVPMNLRWFCLFAHKPRYFLKRGVSGVVLMSGRSLGPFAVRPVLSC